MLRNCLVCGIVHKKWQQRLLAEGDTLTYSGALKLLLAPEAAERQAKDIADEKPPTDVHQVRPPRQLHRRRPTTPAQPRSTPCYRGGKHDQAKCRFRNEECHYCHKKGHIAAVCRQKAKKQQSTNNVVNSSEPDPPEYPMHTLESPPSQPISVQVRLNSTPVTMEMDT